MSLTARVPANADTNLFIPKLYCNRVIEAAKKDLVAWDAISSEWRDDLVLGNILYIPKTNVVSAGEVIVGTKRAALDPLATTGVTLTINQWYEAPIDIDYMTIRQTQANVEELATTESTYAIKLEMDSYVCDLFSTLGGYSATAYGSDGQTLNDDILLYCKETLDEYDVPMVLADRSIIIDPSGLVDMLKIDKLVSADYSKMGAITNGIIGNSVYGCKVRVTNDLTISEGTVGSYGVMLHKKAIASAAQIDTAWVKEYEDLHLRRYQAEALWGATVAQAYFGIPFYTRKT